MRYHFIFVKEVPASKKVGNLCARQLENMCEKHAYLSLLKEMQCSQEIGSHRTGFNPGQKNDRGSIKLTLNITLYAYHLQLRENCRFNVLGWLNQCRGAILMGIFLMWTSR